MHYKSWIVKNFIEIDRNCKNRSSVPNGTNPFQMVLVRNTTHHIDRRSDTVEEFLVMRRRQSIYLIGKWRPQSPATPLARILMKQLTEVSKN
jgi:hypothetical protein